ncbi:MAG: protein-L-isoaspartate(D-aspartate) O-methyltransferase [Acetobacteraceae bacterium]|nr:protein-L-isoaspartate(D-aspartate) O-methyltransferase [Acetobacteraceae bacterium]
MDPIETLIARIEAEARATAPWTGRPVLSPRVLDALRATDRAAFMPASAAAKAYADAPYPIGHGQTISQPFIVALMTDLLDLTPDSRVLEVGTGSGYQAAVLARLAREVFSIETIPALSRQAGEALARAGLRNVALRVGDGAAGWPEAAPFDAIIVTAAAAGVPPALLDQLASPGRMVVPVGPPGAEQELRLIARDEAGAMGERGVLAVRFVPLVRPGAEG